MVHYQCALRVLIVVGWAKLLSKEGFQFIELCELGPHLRVSIASACNRTQVKARIAYLHKDKVINIGAPQTFTFCRVLKAFLVMFKGKKMYPIRHVTAETIKKIMFLLIKKTACTELQYKGTID